MGHGGLLRFEAEGDVKGAEVVRGEFPRAGGGDEEDRVGFDEVVEGSEVEEGEGGNDHRKMVIGN